MADTKEKKTIRSRQRVGRSGFSHITLVDPFRLLFTRLEVFEFSVRIIFIASDLVFGKTSGTQAIVEILVCQS